MNSGTILVTGGAGYIGSHLSLAIAKLGFDVIIINNLSNGSIQNLINIEKILKKKITFYNCNISDNKKIFKILSFHKIFAVFHLAALKDPKESFSMKKKYFLNNVIGTQNLIKAMRKAKIFKLIFSSSAAIYGYPKNIPIDEDHKLNPTNPYGLTKLLNEKFFKKIATKNKKWKIIALRYFNPLGADKSGLIGDNPANPTNIMPALHNAYFKKKKFYIFGDTYNTKDGTCIRDYIHINDVVNAHLTCLKKISKVKGYKYYNIGTGKGYSVLQLLNKFKKINNLNLKVKIHKKRKGDISAIFANVKKIEKEFHWKSKYSLSKMIKSSYNFYKKNHK